MKLELQFDSLSAFLQMGGHGPYIWAAFGITLAVLVANIWWPRRVRQQFVNSEKPVAEKVKGQP